ncbi:lysine transporter LysE [Opitutaceae bacterium TAV5]|nr:lysine transporter LysE [Opitutaceae bacterium TAV5]
MMAGDAHSRLRRMFREFLLISSAHFLALLSPGQDFLLLVRTSLRHGFRVAAGASAGIALANAVWIGVAIFAIGRVREWPVFMRLLQWAGAAVLVYMGWHFLRVQPAGAETLSGEKQAYGEPGWKKAFVPGLLSGLGNPKNGLFYASLFSVGLSPETPLAWQTACGIWMVAVVFGWDLFICALTGREATRRALARWQWRIEQAAGALLIVLGVAMALSS